ncbi:MAG: ABC transporter permease [Bacillota bacterium]|nr:ABC transporter permease [Bacillota bacterium]MDW7678019.1 ABC transporter permease [Bacillota bacterium]
MNIIATLSFLTVRQQPFMTRLLNLMSQRRTLITDSFWQHIQISLTALVIIIAIGIPLGILITRTRRAAPYVIGFTGFLYTIPVIAFFGFMLPILGTGEKPAIAALLIYGLLPLVRNTYVGITEVDEGMLEAARGMGSTNAQILRYVEIPMALPYIIAAIRTVTVMTISIATIAAFIGGGGLGVLIFRGITTRTFELTVAGSILVALLAIVTDGLLGLLERWINRRYFGVMKK